MLLVEYGCWVSFDFKGFLYIVGENIELLLSSALICSHADVLLVDIE